MAPPLRGDYVVVDTNGNFCNVVSWSGASNEPAVACKQGNFTEDALSRPALISFPLPTGNGTSP